MSRALSCPPVWQTTSGCADGPHVVLIHGSLDRSAGLVKLSRRLTPTMRVTRYDRRGYGRSVPCAGPFGIVEQVDDLGHVVAHADPSGAPVVLVGHSYGGDVALAFAQEAPARVAAVVVYESPLAWLPWWPADAPGSRARAGADGSDADAAERFMRHLIGDERWERLPASTRVDRRAEGVAMVAELSDLGRGAPFDGSAIDVPVLALHGELSRPHHVRAMRELAAMVPDGEVATIAGARHFGPNTHPDATAAHVVRVVTSAAR